MRYIESKRVQKLIEETEPFMRYDRGLIPYLDESAPEEIKEKYKECRVLASEERELALNMVQQG